MDHVYIYGPPGVGKLTVAREVAQRIGYKLFHNHLSIDAIAPIFDFGTERFWSLVFGLREQVLEAAAEDDVNLVYTSVFGFPKDLALVARRFDLVERHGGRICLVKLSCDQSELERRIVSETRKAMRKLTDVATFYDQTKDLDVYARIPNRPSLEVDNTSRSAEDVASLIVEHYRLNSANLSPQSRTDA